MDKKENSYIDDFKEYQQNQYMPGYYTGGRLPIHIKYPTKWVGYLFLFLSLAVIGMTIFMGNLTEWGSIAILSISVLMLVAGIRILVTKR